MQIKVEQPKHRRAFRFGYGVVVPVVSLVAVYLFLVLAANSHLGSRLILEAVNGALPGSVHADSVEVLPTLNRVRARHLGMVSPAGREVIHANDITCSIDLRALPFGRYVLRDCVVRGGRVLIHEEPWGEVGVSEVFSATDRNKQLRARRPALVFLRADLRDVDVLVNIFDLSLLFTGTNARAPVIELGRRGFFMEADHIEANGGRMVFSERLLGYGSGRGSLETMRWEVLRDQDPWKAIATPYPTRPEGFRGIADFPVERFHVRDIVWERDALQFGSLDARAGDLGIDAGGWIRFLPETPRQPQREAGVVSFDGRARVELTPDSELLQYVLPGVLSSSDRLDPRLAIKPLVFDAWGSVRFFEGATHLRARDLRVLDWHVDRIDARLRLNRGTLHLEPGARLDLWDGTVTGHGTFVPRTGVWQAVACARNVDLAMLLGPLLGDDPAVAPFLAARVNTIVSTCDETGRGGIRFHGDLTSKAVFELAPARQTLPDRVIQDPMIALQVTGLDLRWPGGLPGLPVDRVAVDVDAWLDQRGVIHFAPERAGQPGLAVRGRDVRLDVRGGLDAVTGALVDLRLDARTPDAGAFLAAAGAPIAPVGMGLRLGMDLSGHLLEPVADVIEVEIDQDNRDALVPEYDLSARLVRRGVLWDVRSFAFDSNVGDLDLAGSIGLFDGPLTRPARDPRLDLRLRGRELDLSILPLPFLFDARVHEADLAITGRLSRPRVDGPFTAWNVRIGSEWINGVRALLRIDGPVVALDELYVNKGKGQVRGGFAWNLSTNHVSFDLSGRRFLLEESDTILGSGLRLGGSVQFDLAGEGPAAALDLSGSVIVDDIDLDGRQLGTIVLVSHTINGAILAAGMLGSDVNLALEVPHHNRPITLSAWFSRMQLETYAPELADAFGGSHASGNLVATLAPAGRSGNPWSAFEAAVELDLTDVQLRTAGRLLGLREEATIRWNGTSSADGRLRQTVRVEDLAIGADGRFAELNGVLRDLNDLNATLSGQLDLSLLRLIPSLVADAEGTAQLDIRADGTLQQPQLGGTIDLDRSRIAPRGLGTTLFIERGRLFVSSDTLTIRQDQPLTGRIFNGDFSVAGTIGLRGLIPNSLDLGLGFTGLAYRIPNELNITLNGDVRLRVAEIAEPETWDLRGDVEIVDARYYRDIEIISDLFSLGGIGRTVATFSQPIWQTNPIINAMQTDLTVTGRDRLRVVSSIANAELALEFRTDLRVTGRLGQMNVVGEMTFLDNSRIYYGGRRFDVSDGILLFDGFVDEDGFPWPVMYATLETELRSSCAARGRGTLDTQRDTTSLARRIDETPTIYMRLDVQGRMPLDMTFTLESRPFYDQRDQLSLILTGCSFDELTGGSGAAPTLELVFRPVIEVVERSIEERFNIDDVDFIPTPTGSAEIFAENEVSERFIWTLRSTVGADDTTQQSVSARYSLYDFLILELIEQSGGTIQPTVDGGVRFRLRLR